MGDAITDALRELKIEANPETEGSAKRRNSNSIVQGFKMGLIVNH